MSLLEVYGLTKTYAAGRRLWGPPSGFPALRGVSLRLEQGECLGIVGESGSGKSTLGRLVLGLERPTEGRVFLLGADWPCRSARETHALRRSLQAVFQDSGGALNPRMTARQIVTEPLRNYERLSPAELERRCLAALEEVGLAPADAGRLPHQFSGGQQQRLCIARALVLRPKLIVLDEAVSSLDRMLQAQILELLKRLKAQHKLSYLFISHDLQAADYLADRIAVMDRGEIVEHTSGPGGIGQLVHPVSVRLLDARLPGHPAARRRNLPAPAAYL